MAKKRSYKQNEVVKELDIQPYVLRYWETEFPFLKEGRKGSGPRTFSPDEVEQLRRIRELLYEEGYTIAGARKRIEAERSGDSESTAKAPAAPAKASAKRTSSKAASKASATENAGHAADRAALERLRSGVGGALDEARALLAKLEK